MEHVGVTRAQGLYSDSRITITYRLQVQCNVSTAKIAFVEE